MKNLLFTLFLICISFIESKGEIENNNSFNDERTLSTDSVWETIVNAWAYNVTEQEANLINEFVSSSDSLWTEKDNGWNMVYFTNTALDTVVIYEVSPEEEVGYQFLIWTEE